MPVHDWTLVTPGTFHDFHLAWIAEIQRAFNGGLLPSGYYAMAEQVAGDTIPDVLTLQETGATPEPEPDSNGGNGGAHSFAVATAPPRVAITDALSEASILAQRRRRLVIRHSTGDRIVALLEIVSPGNKLGHGAFGAFVDKAIAAINARYHLLVIDLFPPGSIDPTGVHGAIWRDLGRTYDPPVGRPLTLASYRVAMTVTAYVEPIAVCDKLPDMPLFLDPDHYINVPLESTYVAAWEGMPQRWRRVLDQPSPL